MSALGLTEPVHRAIASRLRRGQTAEQLMGVGERTGWWTADDVEWVAAGNEGPRPDGWTLEQVTTPVVPLVDPPRAAAPGSGFLVAQLLQEAEASTALDGETQVIGGAYTARAPRAGQATADTGPGLIPAIAHAEPVDSPAGPYVAVLAVDELLVDHTYQRPLDLGRVRRMADVFDRRLLGLLDVSDRGPGAGPVNRYAIVNGQHRAAAAARRGLTHVACNVHEGLDVAAEAQLMAKLDATTKKLSGHDTWRARRAAGDPVVTDVERIATHHGLRIDGARGDGVLTSYGAAEKLVQQGGPQLLDSTLAVLRAAYGTAAAAWQAPLVTGVGQLLRQHADVDVTRLTRALADTTPVQVRANATAIRDIDGGTLAQNMTRAIAGLYDRTPGSGPRLRTGAR